MTEPGKDLARVGMYARSPLTEKQQYATALAAAGDLVPRNFWYNGGRPINVDGVMTQSRPNPGAILYMLETAAMVGVNPMVGLTNIHIIEGKPSLSANLQAALVREAGHRLRVWTEGEGQNIKAICEIVRSDDPDFTFRVEWGKAESAAAGVDNKDNWKKYRRSMLKARSITECVREACPEVLMGATYSPDELGANTNELGEPIDLQQVPSADMPPAKKERTAAPIVDEVRVQGDPEPAPEHPAEDAPVDQATGEVQAPEPVPSDFDWKTAVEEVKTADEALALYRRAKAAGDLDIEIRRGRQPKRVLGPWLIEIGKGLREAEEAAADAADAEAAYEASIVESGGGPAAVLADDDPNVVDAEVVEEPGA